MNAQEQAKNAIRWIDTLPSYKQAPMGRRGRLGLKTIGFCCLGAGCKELSIDYDPYGSYSRDFRLSVGLRHSNGSFADDNIYYGEARLDDINDNTNAGFKRISKLMKTHPDWMFNPEVAQLIKEHYS